MKTTRLGALLRIHRLWADQDMREMAKEIGMSASTLCRIENGKQCDVADFPQADGVAFGTGARERRKGVMLPVVLAHGFWDGFLAGFIIHFNAEALGFTLGVLAIGGCFVALLIAIAIFVEEHLR